MITGCATRSDNSSVRIVNNDFMNEPSILTVNQIHTLDSTQVSHPASIRFHDSGDIYVMEYKSDKLKLFDGKSFDLKDSIYSPEKNMISSFSYYDGKIILNCSGKRQLHILDAKNPETVLRTTELTDEIPNRIEIMPDGNFFGCFTSNLSGRDNTFWGYDLKMVNDSLKTLKLLNSFFGSYHEGNIDPEIPLFPFSVDRENNTVFAAVSSDKYYRIFAYDTKMNLKFVMNNKAEKTEFTETEKKRIAGLTIKFRLMPFKVNEKTLIESMITDSDGNLWVRKAHDADKFGTDTALIDIFDPDGRYLNTFIIKDIPRTGNFYVKDDFLFTVSPFDSEIRIYKFDKKQIAGSK